MSTIHRAPSPSSHDNSSSTPSRSSSSGRDSGSPRDNTQPKKQILDADVDAMEKTMASEVTRIPALLAGEAVVSTRVTRQPNNSESVPATDPSQHVAVSTQAITVGTGAGGAGHGDVTFDRSGFMAHGNAQAGEHPMGFTAGVVQGNTYAEMAITDGANKYGIGTVNGPGVHGAGGTFTHSAGNMAITAGAFAVGNASRSVEVLEADSAKQQARLLLKGEKFMGLQLTAGVSSGLFGVGARLYGSRVTELELKRWYSFDESRSLMSRSGVFANKLHALGLMPGDATRTDRSQELKGVIPGKLKYNTLNPLDEVKFTKRTTLVGGIAGAAGGVYLGMHGAVAGEFSTTIEMLDASRAKVIITPRASTSKTGGFAADIPLLASANAMMASSSMRLVVLEFDFNHDPARTAYQALMRDKLPLPVVQLTAESKGSHLSRLTPAAFTLPAGVSLKAAAYGEMPMALNLSAGFTGPSFVFGDLVGSMSVQVNRRQMQSAVASTNAFTQRNEVLYEKKKASILPGETVVTASLSHVHMQSAISNGNGAASSNAVQNDEFLLKTSVEYPTRKTNGFRLAESWVRNTLFNDPDFAVPGATGSPVKYHAGIEVKLKLTAQQLVHYVSRHAPPDLALRLTRRSLSNNDIMMAFDWLKVQIGKHGAQEAARVYQFEETDKDAINLEVIDKLPEALQKKADKVLVQLGGSKLDADLGVRDLMPHFKKVSTLIGDIKKVEDFNNLISVKGLTNEELKDTVKKLVETREELTQLIDVKKFGPGKVAKIEQKLGNKRFMLLSPRMIASLADQHQPEQDAARLATGTATL
jgi:hypothetical protein